MKKKLEDVAKLANVSKATVSRVLNNRGYISDKTREKVYQAMQVLDYHPNVLAKQLFQQKTNIIGLLFPMVSNPFFGELVEELEKELYRRGYKVIVGNSLNDPKKEKDYLSQLLTKQIDGLIVGTHNFGIKEYNYENLPVVSIERTVNKEIPVVECDNYQGGRLATQYLYDTGCSNIIHTIGRIVPGMPSNYRDVGYRDKMKELGLKPKSFQIYFDLSNEEKAEQAHEMFNQFPDIDGVVAGNDTEAAIIVQTARELGKMVPEDVRVIGFDGSKIFRALLPELPTIIQPIKSMAFTAVDALEKRIKGEAVKKETTFPVTLYKGDSVFDS